MFLMLPMKCSKQMSLKKSIIIIQVIVNTIVNTSLMFQMTVSCMYNNIGTTQSCFGLLRSMTLMKSDLGNR